jgi:catechol 2,3-dioxygenase-like lactoylglutathione lyase family enzyme
VAVELKNLGAITMFVEDVSRAKAFYGDVFGFTQVFEDENSVVFDLGNTIINLLKVSEAPELIAPVAVASRESGARVQLTIWVSDTNAVCADMAAKGVELLNGPIDRPWGMRTACVEDPDGHIWEFAQNLSETAGS